MKNSKPFKTFNYKKESQSKWEKNDKNKFSFDEISMFIPKLIHVFRSRQRENFKKSSWFTTTRTSFQRKQQTIAFKVWMKGNDDKLSTLIYLYFELWKQLWKTCWNYEKSREIAENFSRKLSSVKTRSQTFSAIFLISMEDWWK